ncbi:hypothetical protein ASG43_02705 [Aureimonas sp. Leaf454]|uniref:pilus assembly protein TadG-related protein n=1 Tax=Aureimonas sp. Leaf454 TaxID=1736381 RepID=UPI0006FCB1FD|nr:pilus assembly protein TadG-related protein [Aureimonas sp. Leaf454]KQT54521.1 hypothetical protein ASG43_02705 [Aureimonas sp. Leaf454]
MPFAGQNRFKRSLRAFAGATHGNFVVIGALTAVPLVFMTGAMIDLSLLYRDQRLVQAALDAAALAAAQQSSSQSDPKVIEATARTFFNANTASLSRTTATMSYEGLSWNSDHERTIRISSCSTYDPFFLTGYGLSAKGIEGSACSTAESVVAISNTTVEVAMVLDTSGSMNDAPAAGGSAKIVTLRAQASKAVQSLFGSAAKTGDDDPVRVAVVPFSGAVNIGPQYLNEWWMDPKGLSTIHNENLDWSSYTTLLGVPRALRNPLYPTRNAYVDALNPLRSLSRQDIYAQFAKTYPKYAFKGCAEARVDPYGTNDTEPSEANPDTLFVPYFAPDEGDDLKKGWVNSYLKDSDASKFETRLRDVNKYYSATIFPTNSIGANNSYSPSYICDSNPLQPLSGSASTTLSTVSKLVATGSTNVDQGVGWGWRVLSRRQPFTDGRASGDEDNIKAMIVMTDGENTYYQDNQNTTNKNLTAFGSYGFAATERIFDHATNASKTKNNANYTSAIDARTSIVCANAKNDGRIALRDSSGQPVVDGSGAVMRDGIIIYTIAFDIPLSSKARVDALLKGCASYKLSDLRDTAKPYASKGKYFYSASNDKELDAAFADIMASLSKTRITR